jgi:hypothetical protein
MGYGIAGCHLCQLEERNIENQFFVFGKKEADEASNASCDAKRSNFVCEEISDGWVRVFRIGYLVSN